MSHIRQRSLSRTKLATSVSLGTALFAGLVSSTQAADMSQADTTTLPEVSVNASQEAVVSDYQKERMSSTKFTSPVSKTPQTIQIIDKSLIEDQHATTLTEALKNSPGVGTFYVGENGNTSTGDSVYMRGFNASSTIFVDGVRDTGSISRDTFNTEQVEVIKGPNGADYGRTAPGGSINMATKQAHLHHAHSASISGGTDDQKRVTLDVNHQLGEHTAVRLNLMGEDSGVAGRDKVENQRWGVAPAVSFGLGTDKRLHLNYLHISQNNTPDGGVPTIGLPGYNPPASQDPSQIGFDVSGPPTVDSSNFYGTNSDHDDVTVDMITALFEQDFGDSKTFHNTTRFGRTHQDYQLSSFMFSVDTSNPYEDSIHSNGQPNNPAAWSMRRMPNFKDQTNTILTNQSGIVQYLNTGKVNHTLSYGLELTREKIETVGMGTPLDASFKPTLYQVNIYDPSHTDPSYYGVRNGADGKGSINTAAIYLFDTVKFNDHVSLLAGLRLDHYSAEFESSVACASRGAPACTSQTYTATPGVDASVSDNLFTWQLGAVYQINDAGNVYVDFAVAAQPPGGDTLELSSSASSANNPNFDPQKAKTAEVGTKWKLVNDRLLLTAALYRTELTNEVESDGGSPAQYVQTGKKRVQGIELSAVGQLTRNWNVSAGFTTMKAEVIEGAADANDGSSELPYSPTQAFTSWTSYRLPFGLIIGGGARYNGELKRGRDGAAGTPDYTKSYWVVDAMAQYPVSKTLDVQLNVYNVFDKEYVAAINKSGYRYTPGTPLSAILSLNLKF